VTLSGVSAGPAAVPGLLNWRTCRLVGTRPSVVGAESAAMLEAALEIDLLAGDGRQLAKPRVLVDVSVPFHWLPIGRVMTVVTERSGVGLVS